MKTVPVKSDFCIEEHILQSRKIDYVIKRSVLKIEEIESKLNCSKQRDDKHQLESLLKEFQNTLREAENLRKVF